MPNWAHMNLLHRGVRNSIVNGGGGSGPASGPSLHLDATVAASITTEVGGRVELWEDQSANGNDLSQSTAGQYPTQATLNGLNTIFFDDTNNRLMRAQASVTGCDGGAGNDALTVFCVVHDDMTNHNTYNSPVAYTDFGWSTGWRMNSNAATGANIQASVAAWNSNLAMITDAATAADSLDVIAFTYDGANIKTYLNSNTIVTTQAETASLAPSGAHLVAGAADFAGTYGLFGYVGEIIVYDSVLSSEDFDSTLAYLQAKWQS